MTEKGVICRAINGALAFCPPLIIEDTDIDQMIDTAEEAINEIMSL
jgi:4-aminobutyrate--pyruvate transaminase